MVTKSDELPKALPIIPPTVAGTGSAAIEGGTGVNAARLVDRFSLAVTLLCQGRMTRLFHKVEKVDPPTDASIQAIAAKLANHVAVTPMDITNLRIYELLNQQSVDTYLRISELMASLGEQGRLLTPVAINDLARTLFRGYLIGQYDESFVRTYAPRLGTVGVHPTIIASILAQLSRPKGEIFSEVYRFATAQLEGQLLSAHEQPEQLKDIQRIALEGFEQHAPNLNIFKLREMYTRLTPYWDVMGLPKTCIPFDFNLESSLELLLKGSESMVLIMAISIDADFSNRQELDSLWSYLATYQKVKKELEGTQPHLPLNLLEMYNERKDQYIYTFREHLIAWKACESFSIEVQARGATYDFKGRTFPSAPDFLGYIQQLEEIGRQLESL